MPKTLSETLVAIWGEVLRDGRTEGTVDGLRFRCDRTRGKRLLTVTFTFGDRAVEGIEQNPETSSRWAKMAQEGQRILQFRAGGRYIANVAEGRLTRYPAWTGLGLPD
jgi:hypothetical protein